MGNWIVNGVIINYLIIYKLKIKKHGLLGKDVFFGARGGGWVLDQLSYIHHTEGSYFFSLYFYTYVYIHTVTWLA